MPQKPNQRTLEQFISEHGMPSNTEAEKLVLGICLLDGDAFLPSAADVLKVDDFSLEKHRKIWRRIINLHAEGQHVDRIVVAEALHKHNELEAVDGLSYLISLDDGLPRLPSIDSYVNILLEHSAKRKIIHACHAGIQMAMTGNAKSEEILEEIANQAHSIGESAKAGEQDFYSLAEIVASAGGPGEYLERRRKEGLQTHIPSLNKFTRGFQKGQLVILAARTSRGKTAFAMDLAHHVAQRGTGVAVFSMEMDKESINDRILHIAGKLNSGVLYNPDKHRDQILRTLAKTASLPIYVRSTSSSIISVRSKLKRLIAKVGIGLVIVDYLQIMAPSDRTENRTQEVSAMSRGLKLMAIELGMPFLVLSQFHRMNHDKEPTLSDLRESGSIEQDADIALFLHPKEKIEDIKDQDRVVKMSLMLAKQRQGPIGNIPCLWHRSQYRFEEEYVEPHYYSEDRS